MLQQGSEQGRATMSIKGHFMPCKDKMEAVWGISCLHGLIWGGGGGRGGDRGLEGRENAFGVFLSGNT